MFDNYVDVIEASHSMEAILAFFVGVIAAAAPGGSVSPAEPKCPCRTLLPRRGTGSHGTSPTIGTT